ncbi:ATP-binding protein [Pseudomonas entomophila]|nr:ATP-binding protein [Pseudomonas entomophila]MDF0732996.1 ATP-binding protein [Pseudomonas entomophila]
MPPPSRTTRVIHLAPTLMTHDRMGERIAQFDWSLTAIGPLPQWAPSLRIAVDMMLLSPFPCALVWGGELTVLHNDAYLALLQAPASGLGSGFDQLWRDEWDNIGSWVFQALEGQASFVEDAPLQIDRNDGTGSAWFAFSYSPIRNDDGIVAGFLHTVIESGASVEQVREWRELGRTFEAQLSRYMTQREHIWQLSRDAMVMVSHDLYLLAANPAWYRILGWTEAQVKDLSILELVHPEDHAELHLAVNELMLNKVAAQIETRLRHTDGYYRWFNWSACCDGRVIAAVGRDVTQEREDALLQAQNLLRGSQRMEIVGQLAGGMAHEMNNLLSGVGASLELLQRRLAQGRLERIEEYMRLARDSVQRAIGLTHHLLAFSRSQPLAPKPLDINRKMLELQPLIRQAIGPDIDLRWQLDLAPWPVQVDVAQLENALLTLCANVRDACTDRGVLTISSNNERLTTTTPEGGGLQPGDYVVVQVKDDGHGMPAEAVARAFEPFFTTKPLGRGAGLGLAMVYGFVRQSGGHVWIDSTPNQGTQVNLMLPRYPGELEVVPPVLPLLLRRAKGERLLLVDDEGNLRALMKEALLDQGFEVCDACDGNDALGRYRQGPAFDLVITDIGLPGGFSGRQVARAMRQLRPEQKILFITGYTEYPVEAQLLDQPGTALMLKPFSLEKLLGQVQHMLE